MCIYGYGFSGVYNSDTWLDSSVLAPLYARNITSHVWVLLAYVALRKAGLLIKVRVPSLNQCYDRSEGDDVDPGSHICISQVWILMQAS